MTDLIAPVRRRNIGAWLPLALWLALLGGGALLLEPFAVQLPLRLSAPSWHAIAGRDALGRELAARIALGGMTSIAIGLAAASAALLLGGSLGLLLGWRGGWTEKIILRLADLQQSIPSFLLALALVAALGAGGFKVVIALTVSGWPGMMRIARALALTLKGREFITAARALGATSPRIYAFHLLPAAAPPLVAHFLAQWSGFMLAEAGLSFLGLGLNVPWPSWGNLLKEGADHLLDAPHLLLISAAAAVFTALLLNRAADRLRS